MVQLESCAVGEMVLKELEGAVDDIHSSEIEWIDVLVSFLCEPLTYGKIVLIAA